MSQFNSLKRAIVLLVFASLGFAGEDYIKADLGVSLDYSRFSIEGGVYLDIYLMIPQNFFTYVEGESGVEAKVLFQTALLQDDLVPYPPDRWQRIYRAGSQSDVAKLGYVPDISKFYVEAGEYILQVDIVDLNSNRRQRIRKPVSLELFPAQELSMSDLTIASQIVKTKEENEFTKYGRDVVPNAERTFTPTASMLYFYFETYGLSGTGNYQIHNQILSLNGDVVQDYPIQTKKMPGVSAVEWSGVNTAGLKSGIYKLEITVSDETTGQSTSGKKTFYVLRPKTEKAGADQNVTENDYAALNESQLDELYQVISIIMDKKARRLYSKSDAEGKRNILTAFWDRNDPDLTTPVNEYKISFYQRVQMANRQFSTETGDGWKTDQGRILIQYGKPNNIVRHPSAMGEKPWESWDYYEIEGGVQFIFIDRTGFGVYQLVHSSARDEIQDYGWERLLK